MVVFRFRLSVAMQMRLVIAVFFGRTPPIYKFVLSVFIWNLRVYFIESTYENNFSVANLLKRVNLMNLIFIYMYIAHKETET